MQTNGELITGDYLAELNNCAFAGDVSGCNGTFRGKFTADAVNIVHNPTIAGRATAMTVIVEEPGVITPGQNVWVRIASANINIPSEDTSGGYILAAFKYLHDGQGGDWHPEEAQRSFRERVKIGTDIIFDVSSCYGSLWHATPYRYNEYMININHPGLITVSIEQYYPDEGYNVHPIIIDRFTRVDYIRR